MSRNTPEVAERLRFCHPLVHQITSLFFGGLLSSSSSSSSHHRSIGPRSLGTCSPQFSVTNGFLNNAYSTSGTAQTGTIFQTTKFNRKMLSHEAGLLHRSELTLGHTHKHRPTRHSSKYAARYTHATQLSRMDEPHIQIS